MKKCSKNEILQILKVIVSNVKKVDNIKLRLKMKFRFITKLFIYLLFVIFVLVLNTFVRRKIVLDINIQKISSPDQKPWYMKGGTILPTNKINRELIFPEDYPNNDMIPQQLMLMPPSINSISKIYSTCPKF